MISLYTWYCAMIFWPFCLPGRCKQINGVYICSLCRNDHIQNDISGCLVGQREVTGEKYTGQSLNGPNYQNEHSFQDFQYYTS